MKSFAYYMVTAADEDFGEINFEAIVAEVSDAFPEKEINKIEKAVKSAIKEYNGN